MEKKIKVLIVDDHAILRMGLSSLLNAGRDIEVVGDADSGTDAICKSQKLNPDVVIMDLMMPEMDGAEATRLLLEKQPGAHILILTTFGTSDGIARALENGALGAVMKNVGFPELLKAIRSVANGKHHLPAEVKALMADDPPAPPLSQRQSEILASIMRGLSNNDIAKLLGIGPDMVKAHINQLFQKLGAANRAEAVAIALRKHLLKA